MLEDFYRTQEKLDRRDPGLVLRRQGEPDDRLVARVAREVQALWQETGQDPALRVTHGPDKKLKFRWVPNPLSVRHARQIVRKAVRKRGVSKPRLLLNFFAYRWGKTFDQARGAIERAQERFPQVRPPKR